MMYIFVRVLSCISFLFWLFITTTVAARMNCGFQIYFDDELIGHVKETIVTARVENCDERYRSQTGWIFVEDTTPTNSQPNTPSTGSNKKRTGDITTADSTHKVYWKQYRYLINRKISSLGFLFDRKAFLECPVGWTVIVVRGLTEGSSGRLPVIAQRFIVTAELGENPEAFSLPEGFVRDFHAGTFYLIDPVLQFALMIKTLDARYHQDGQICCSNWQYDGAGYMSALEMPVWQGVGNSGLKFKTSYALCLAGNQNEVSISLDATTTTPRRESTGSSGSGRSGQGRTRLTLQSVTGLVTPSEGDPYQLRYETRSAQPDVAALRSAAQMSSHKVAASLTAPSGFTLTADNNEYNMDMTGILSVPPAPLEEEPYLNRESNNAPPTSPPVHGDIVRDRVEPPEGNPPALFYVHPGGRQSNRGCCVLL
ncbi:hypothetical protein [Spongorhabdus nitratireducens]